MAESEQEFGELIGKQVVLDAASLFVYLGTLKEVRRALFVLEDADVHDLRDTTTTRELYVRDAKRHGINANRKRVFVRRDDIISLTALAEVLE